ncbi:hypothetical protein Taro_010493 [Colocasia esculenta]|uniref:Uncharacterized protein n=1 Tax=Colocasia esculenta TaxID=4460 RepID=A0A843U9Q6_COLES|nr:hypothetical protein [Colocasia esculenta]
MPFMRSADPRPEIRTDFHPSLGEVPNLCNLSRRPHLEAMDYQCSLCHPLSLTSTASSTPPSSTKKSPISTSIHPSALGRGRQAPSCSPGGRLDWAPTSWGVGARRPLRPRHGSCRGVLRSCSRILRTEDWTPPTEISVSCGGSSRP